MVATSAEARSQIVALVRDFVRREVEPVAAELDREDRVPHDLIDQMKELGLFGITVPEEYGGLGLDYTTFASIFEELSMGLMSLSGAIGTHHILTYVLTHYGTEEQKERFLPDLASGKKRGGLALTEPGGGTDVANLQTTATKDGEEYVINGSKMFITNGRYGDMFCLLARTDRDMEPRHRGLSAFVMERGEPGSGFEVGRDLDKLGYRGLDTVELNFNNYAIPADNLIGEQEGVGFGHVMSGLETGRINVAARAVGVAQAAFNAAIRYAQQRESFGKPIAEHQAIQLKLADMATKDSGGAAAGIRRRHQEGRGRAHRPGVGHGQAVRQRGLRRGYHGGHARPRRLRVHQGVAGGALLPRRAADDNRRRHQRGDAAGDSAAVAAATGVPDLARRVGYNPPHSSGVHQPGGFNPGAEGELCSQRNPLSGREEKSAAVQPWQQNLPKPFLTTRLTPFNGCGYAGASTKNRRTRLRSSCSPDT